MLSSFALVHGCLVDGLGGEPVPDACVLIRDGRLTAVGPATGVCIPPGVRQVDVRGCTLMPALLDGHMHISPEPGNLDHMGHVNAALSGLGRLQNCLQWGTGTVGHAAGSLESVLLRKAIRSAIVRGCADLLVGVAVTPTCGHVRGLAADGPWEIRRALRQVIAGGADWIKTCASGGFQHDHEKLTHEDYSLEELRVVTDMAHSRDLRVHVHAHAQPGIGNAVAAGCDVILHGALIDESALEGIAQKNLWYMPTLHITSTQVHERPSLPAYMRERMKQASPIHRAGVAQARGMGIRIAVGTDGGPGSVMNELCELVDCGFSPLEALVAATRNTAEALGVHDEVGTLETGKRANILVVEGNPLQQIRIMTSQDAIALVIHDGVIVRQGLRMEADRAAEGDKAGTVTIC